MSELSSIIETIAKNGMNSATGTYRFIIKICDNLLKKVNIPDKYLSYSEREKIIEDAIEKAKLSLNKIKLFKKVKIEDIALIRSMMSSLLELHNKQFVSEEIKHCTNLFDNILGHSLDEEQRKAIVSDDDRCLIVAGAGAGKTLTMVGKVAYLYHIKKVNPERILTISFTKKAAQEMQERLVKQLGTKEVLSCTFHKLGLDIIEQNTPTFPNRPDENILLKAIQDYYISAENNTDDSSKDLLQFLSYYLYVPVTKDENVSFTNIVNAEKACDLETLRSKISLVGEKMKSQEEVIIANFLYLNGIEYEYERPYPRDLGFSYKPDFYLPDYDIYLEHFGITEQNTCPWLPPKRAQKYIADINKKEKLHKKYGTKLLETYSYYHSEGVLLEKLWDLLKENGVKIKPRSHQEIIKKILERQDRRLKEFTKLMSRFIVLFKSQGYGEQELERLLKENPANDNSYFAKRKNLFIKIAIEIFRRYQTSLQETDSIDFSDMMWNAISLVKNTQMMSLPYQYIIVDEYQDMGRESYELIKAILERTGAKLMCIGDDWQSIYRFSGSKLDLFTSFEDYWGPSSIFRLKKTYRNAQELIDICTSFITKNPNQLVKKLVSDKHLASPIRLVNYEDNKLGEKIGYILDKIAQDNEHSSVLLLGRHNEDITPILNTVFYSEGPNPSKIIPFILAENQPDIHSKERNTSKIIYTKHPNLKIDFLTVHKAKGLEADNVILINCKNSLFGFPNKLEDDPIISFLLTKAEFMPYAEERRLMYVALTRTKKYAYLMVPIENPSEFVGELVKLGVKKPANNSTTLSLCPLCKVGKLQQHAKNGKVFYGCSNFPVCRYIKF